jgi:hypothetical protein
MSLTAPPRRYTGVTITGHDIITTAAVAIGVFPLIGIRDIERPDDLEALEHGKDIVVELESFPSGLPTEIAATGSEPPVSRPVPFSLVPSERLVDLGQRFDHHLRWYAR